MNFDHLNGRILAAHNNPLNPAGIANYVFEKTPEGFHHPYIGSIYCVDDQEARQASAFRPGKESAKPVRASLGATDQSAAVAQEHQPCELFPIARA